MDTVSTSSWFTVRRSGGTALISFFGELGCFDAGDVTCLIEAAKDAADIQMTFDTLGGNSDAGLKLHHAFRGRASTAIIKPRCGSAALTVALAAQRVLAVPDAKLLVHQPIDSVMGNSRDLRLSADSLDRLSGKLIDIYTSRTGRPQEEVSRWFDGRDHWLCSERALAAGLVDEIIEPPKIEMPEADSPAKPETIAAPATAIPNTIDKGNEALFFDFLHAFGPVRIRDRRSFARNLNVLLAQNVKEIQ